jgi:beta-glucosidase
VGIALALSPVEPASDSQADADAAHLQDGFANRWFLDPLFRGRYPEDVLEHLGDDAPEVQPGDMERIATPVDVLGVTHFSRTVVRHEPAAELIPAAIVQPEGRPRTATGWEVYPEGLYEVLARVHADYQPPAILVSANGAAFPDTMADGEVRDAERRRYIHEHLLQAHRAIEEGVPLRGYFVWSLLDGFEWTHGYDARFGLIHVDHTTQRRTIKESGRWYAEVTRDNGVASGA